MACGSCIHCGADLLQDPWAAHWCICPVHSPERYQEAVREYTTRNRDAIFASATSLRRGLPNIYMSDLTDDELGR